MIGGRAQARPPSLFMAGMVSAGQEARLEHVAQAFPHGVEPLPSIVRDPDPVIGALVPVCMTSLPLVFAQR
jgi:hypothetical protein